MKPQITKPRHHQIGLAYKGGLKSTAPNCYGNPYRDRDGGFPEDTATVRGAQWFAHEAGRRRSAGDIEGAGTQLRNARFFLRRAIARGLA